MFYIGGDFANSNVELHDVRFAVGSDYGACLEDLRRQWWGDPKTLHIDAYAEISHADGFDVTLVKAPAEQNEKLFFLNMGGYDPAEFGELHRNVLLVGSSLHDVQRRALTDARRAWKSPHKDSAFEVEKAICLNDMVRGSGLHIQLTPAALHRPLDFTCRYQKIA